jgi:hypothetical protein
LTAARSGAKRKRGNYRQYHAVGQQGYWRFGLGKGGAAVTKALLAIDVQNEYFAPDFSAGTYAVAIHAAIQVRRAKCKF